MNLLHLRENDSNNSHADSQVLHVYQLLGPARSAAAAALSPDKVQPTKLERLRLSSVPKSCEDYGGMRCPRSAPSPQGRGLRGGEVGQGTPRKPHRTNSIHEGLCVIHVSALASRACARKHGTFPFASDQSETRCRCLGSP